MTNMSANGKEPLDQKELLIQKVKIPFKITKRGKHKPHIIKPNNSVDERIMDDALVQALGKAKLWEMELMSGLNENRAATIDLEEFYRKKRLTQKYVLKVLRLNTLSPRIKAEIMNGMQPKQWYSRICYRSRSQWGGRSRKCVLDLLEKIFCKIMAILTFCKTSVHIIKYA
jgi:hypothetical protein